MAKVAAEGVCLSDFFHLQVIGARGAHKPPIARQRIILEALDRSLNPRPSPNGGERNRQNCRYSRKSADAKVTKMITAI